MACDIQNQIKVYSMLSQGKIGSVQDILNIITTVLPKYTIEQALEDFESKAKSKLIEALKSVGYNFAGTPSIKTDSEERPVNNINSIFMSPMVTDLFDSLHTAEDYFKAQVNELVTRAKEIGMPNSDHHIRNNFELNLSIKGLKNKLFETILRYLKNNGYDYDKYFFKDRLREDGKLYDVNGSFKNFELYKEVIGNLETLLLGNNPENLIVTTTNKKIPNLKGDIRNSFVRTKYDAYNAAILLVNFDNILSKFFSDTIKLDYSSFNDFAGREKSDKYTFRRTGKTTTYWSNETHREEGAQENTDQLSTEIINIIRHVNKDGLETGLYLDTRNIYDLGSSIREFERVNLPYILNKKLNADINNPASNPEYIGWDTLENKPVDMMNWYMNKILEAFDNKFEGSDYSRYKDFRDKIDIIKSLKNFLSEIELKEQNSNFKITGIITQVLNNTFGANYLVNNAPKHKLDVKEMHSHNAGRVSVQNSVYAHLSANTSLRDKFWVLKPEAKKEGETETLEPEKKDTSKKELEAIQKIVDNNQVLSNFIKSTLGIYIGTHGAEKLKTIWGDKAATRVQDYLKSIRSGDEQTKSVLDRIVENEKNIEERILSDVDTPSEVITNLSSNIQDIIDIYLDNNISKPIMTINTLTGESIPTYRLNNLMYNDTAVLLERAELERQNKGNRFFNTIFLSDENHIKVDKKDEITTNILLGTSTGLEAVNGIFSKSTFDFNIIENFKANFEFSFLNAFKINSDAKGINVMIGNYSDKGSILSKIIGTGAIHDGKFIIGNSLGQNIMPMDELLELTRKQSANYYKDLVYNIFEQYEKLGVKIKKNDVEGNIKAVNKFLQGFENKNSFLEYVIQNNLNDNSVNIIEELHYSEYMVDGRKKLSMNQLIIDYYNIFNNQANFNEFIKLQETNLTRKLLKEKGELLFDSQELSIIEGSKIIEEDSKKSVVDDWLTSFGVTKQDYKPFLKTEKGTIVGHRILLENGRINPLLKRWMWVNNLFRSEYLFLTVKPEYMHPYKLKGGLKLDFRGNKELDLVAFEKESSLRLPNMAKRNVSYTATFESPLRNSKKGIPNDVNIAIIEDATDLLYNISGETHKQDIHDGSSIVNYLYSRMIDESYPGKNYGGTKKRIGTIVTEFGSALKKDAETVLTNDRIRKSEFSDISFRYKQEQMLSAMKLPYIEEYNSGQLSENNIYYKAGNYYKINSYKIIGDSQAEKNQLILNLSIYNAATKTFKRIKDVAPIQVNTLFDIWEAFGGEYSASLENEVFKFNEGSNELLYDLTVDYIHPTGIRALKDNFIHIISNHSSFKSGASNLNPANYWTDNRKLGFSTFKSTYMGPQLSAEHEADASKIKEITQIISALSQNPVTAHIAEEIYNDIARIIEESAAPYLVKISDLDQEKMDKYYKILSKSFAYNLANSEEVSLAKSIAESFDRGVALPFSNQNFFSKFVGDMITKMNNEFIVRYYQGIGAVLNPSHKMIQLFEDNTGKVYMQDELAAEAFTWFSNLLEEQKTLYKTNHEIITAYLTTSLKFQNKSVSLEEIAPGDQIIANGVSIDLSSINNYYEFKLNPPQGPYFKVLSKPRDLAPSRLTYTIGGITYNIFDSEPLKFKYILDLLEKGTISQVNKKHIKILDLLAEHWGIAKDEKYYTNMTRKLNQWNQRNLDLLENKMVMQSIEKFIEGGKTVAEYFGKDTLINKRLDEIIDHYKANNSVLVDSHTFKPAEMILGNMYKGTFDTGSDSIETIRSNKDYFRNKLDNIYTRDNTKADLKLVLKNGENPIFVKYVTRFPDFAKDDQNLFTEIYDEATGQMVLARIGIDGQPLYIKPPNSIVVKGSGYETIYLKLGNYIKVDKDGKPVGKTLLHKNFRKNLRTFIKSFRGELRAIVPLMNGQKELLSQVIDENGNPEDINKISFNEFKKFSGYITNDEIGINNGWFVANREKILDQLGTKIYASWEKSNEVIAARIPAQSMQSFMEMRNIGYFNTESNDVFVSVWQIWFQGSDFDIDKAYIMGYGFNKNGQFDTWTNISDYSTKEQLDALESLPLPTGNMTTLVDSSELVNSAPDITLEFNKFSSFAIAHKINANEYKGEIFNLSPEVIYAFGNALRKGNNLQINPKTALGIEYKDLFLALINEHNTNRDYLHKNNALKNSVVSKIKRIISSPTNQLLASEPVSVQQLHDAGDAAKEELGFEEDLLSAWDMLSMYKQQMDAAVGKADVGIGANGIKVFFALSNYYNKYYTDVKNGNVLVPNYLQDFKTFEKRFTINKKTRVITTIANVGVPENYYNDLLTSLGYNDLKAEELRLSETQAALAASGFISGATDNAKELVMAKINAVVDLASMHLYLISLGYSMEDIAIYMNSDLGRFVAKNISGNIFTSTKIITVANLANQYKASHPGSEDEVNQFMDIYDGAQEFRVLASVLKVNQKTSANVSELYKFLTTIENAIFVRENAALSNYVINLRKPELWDNTYTLTQNGKVSKGTLIDLIIENNPVLRKDPSSKETVRKVLVDASEISVKYIDEKGFTRTKSVSLLGGQFDFRYYMHHDNDEYRRITRAYYNLFKNTINVFDVIDKSPHFREMVNGVAIMHEVLSTYSKKYNFAFNRMRDIIRDYGNKVISASNENISYTYNNRAFPIRTDETILNREFRTFDSFLMSGWAKSSGGISSFRFNAKDLLTLAGESQIILNTSNKAKYESVGNIKSFRSLPSINQSTIVIDKNSEDFIVDLTTDYGVANFKILMEQVILKILDKSNRSNLAKSLRLMTVKNSLGLPGVQITSTFGISNLNLPINAEKFQELLAEFNDVDKLVENEFKIKNAEGSIIPYQDLFYVYNLLVNNEMYGDKRLTPLFEDYIKYKNTIGHEYLMYCADVDAGKIDIFKIPELGDTTEDINMQNKLEENQIDNILFMTFHKGGKLYVSSLNEILTIKNANFIMNTSAEPMTKKSFAEYAILDSIISIINNKNLIINFNCD